MGIAAVLGLVVMIRTARRPAPPPVPVQTEVPVVDPYQHEPMPLGPWQTKAVTRGEEGKRQYNPPPRQKDYR